MAHGDDDPGAFLGVGLTEEIEHSEGGARITHVMDDSPAAAAGIEAGDVIVRFDGNPVRGPGGLGHRIGERQPGDRVEIVVLRDGREQTLDVELGERPNRFSFSFGDFGEHMGRVNIDLGDLDLEDLQEHLGDLRIELDDLNLDDLHEHLGDMRLQLKELHGDGEHFRMRVCEDDDCQGFDWSGRRPVLGVGLIEPTDELRRHLGGDDDRGVLVSRVYEDSAAEAAGIEVGDLIVSVAGRDVDGAWAIRGALMENAGRTIAIDVIRDGSPVALSASIPEADDAEARPSRRSVQPSEDSRRLQTSIGKAHAAYALALRGARESQQTQRSVMTDAARAYRRALATQGDSRQQYLLERLEHQRSGLSMM
jgi:membrane-associated protease RseP (regulator of RpoE activity)